MGEAEGEEDALLGGTTRAPPTRPWAAPAVVAAEFCERFAYYGVVAVFSIYMQQMLGFGDEEVAACATTFFVLCYSSVLPFGYCADRFWGRRLTIVVAGSLYLSGLVLLTLSSSPLGYADFPFLPTWAQGGFIASLVLIGLGTGGIKANVGPLMADQLGPESDMESAWRWFYVAINAGAFLGMLLSPLLRRIGGPVAFPTLAPTTLTSSAGGALPSCSSDSGDGNNFVAYYWSVVFLCALWLLGATIFLLGYPYYRNVPPTGSLLSRSVRIVVRARSERIRNGAGWLDLPSNGNHWLDWSGVAAENSADNQLKKDLKQTMSAVAVFSIFPLYWLLYLQMMYSFVLQAEMMELPSIITPDQMGLADEVFVIILIPFFDFFLYPALKKRAGIAPTAVSRMVLGFLFVSLAFFISAALQAYIDSTGSWIPCGTPGSGSLLFIKPGSGGASVFLQLIPYFFIALSEIFAVVAALEFAYSAAPLSMKSLVMAYAQFMTAIGGILGLLLAPVTIEQNFTWLFLAYGIAMLALTVLFAWLFRERMEVWRPSKLAGA